MLRKILLPTILLVLAYGFWLSPNFQEISAGVAIFLFGMLSLEEGFHSFTGGTLEKVLRATTSNRWKSLGFGVVSTTIMQSSSLVSVITISFLSAGLISLAAGIGIIFGANLGTTTGAWLIAGFGLKVKISAYAMPMLVFGIVLMFQSSRKLKGIGYILAGLGFLFLGIHYMKEGFEAFKDTLDLAQFSVAGYPGVFLFAAIGIFATVVMQSSHATLVLIITALAAQQITYENALALAIGANVGTTITAILGSLSANESGKRLAGAHLIFNMTTGLISIALIYQLVDAVNWLSDAVGIGAEDYTLKLAVFHTIFNLIGILVMLPFITPLVNMLERYIPDSAPELDQPKYLSESSAEFPDTAVEAVRKESMRVYKSAVRIITECVGINRHIVRSDSDLMEVANQQSGIQPYDIDSKYEKHIKSIYSAIIAFIAGTRFSRHDEQASRLRWLRDANQYAVESVKATKHLQKNLLRFVGADNPHIHDAYNDIRVRVTEVIRTLEEMRQSSDDTVDLLSLDSLKLTVDEYQKDLNKKVTELIGDKLITPEMGISLLNDSSYAYDISINLIRSAQLLLVTQDEELLAVARSMLLDKSDRTEIMDLEMLNNPRELHNES